ncbi:MAG: hypothetical protein AB1816_00160 [Bacillota bacterium]
MTAVTPESLRQKAVELAVGLREIASYLSRLGEHNLARYCRKLAGYATDLWDLPLTRLLGQAQQVVGELEKPMPEAEHCDPGLLEEPKRHVGDVARGLREMYRRLPAAVAWVAAGVTAEAAPEGTGEAGQPPATEGGVPR